MQTLPMARPLRFQFAHVLYHVTSPDNAREAIVKTVADRQAFLDGFAQVVDRFEWRCHAYRLMNNSLLQEKHTPKRSLDEAYPTHGYQRGGIADHFGLHYFSMSQRIRQAEEGGA